LASIHRGAGRLRDRAYVTSTQGSQPSTGQPILDAALAAFIALLLTWIVVFLLGMSRTPSQLFYEQMGRANTLEERLRPKIKVLGLHQFVDSTRAFNRIFDLEIQNASDEELHNCLAVVTDLTVIRKGSDGPEVRDWTRAYKPHLPKALRTVRNVERDGGGPFHLRAWQTKKISICSRDDGEHSELKIHYESGGPDYIYEMPSVESCEMEVTIYGTPTPTVEVLHFRVNDKNELTASRFD
jgi:hypothetical protein